MGSQLLVPVMLILFLVSNPLFAALKIPIISIDESGKILRKEVHSFDFIERFGKTVELFADSAMLSLEKQNIRGDKWVLNQVYLGAQLGLSFGLGNLLKFSAEPSFYLILKKRGDE